MKALFHEPLVHFLLLGMALFALDAWLRPGAAPDAAGVIVVDAARVNNLAANFARTWQRQPSPAELEGLIEDYVREEVYYREALALGLDRDDAILRRRLRQKVEFLSTEAAALAQPSEQELAAYLAAHPEAFRSEGRVTFQQVFLDPRRRAGTLEAEAKRLLEELNRATEAAVPEKLGDSRLHEPRYVDFSESDVAKTFSSDFAESLFRQPTGVWTGPIPSAYGKHLVRVESLTPGRVPALEKVRPQVEREWTNARRKELSEAFYQRLRAKYPVRIARPEQRAAGGGSGPVAGQNKP